MSRAMKLLEYISGNLNRFEEDYFEIVMNEYCEATSIRMISDFNRNELDSKYIYPNNPEGRRLAMDLITFSDDNSKRAAKNLSSDSLKTLISNL